MTDVLTSGLCEHHRVTLGRWRDAMPHEDANDFRRRCQTIAAQCCRRGAQ